MGLFEKIIKEYSQLILEIFIGATLIFSVVYVGFQIQTMFKNKLLVGTGLFLLFFILLASLVVFFLKFFKKKKR